jgi:putative endonuclease
MILDKAYFVYILSSRKNGTLYIGVTNDLKRRIWEHRNEMIKGFTQEYGIHKLVYFEQHQDVVEAILREKQLKFWKRKWKIELIEKDNFYWEDLFDQIL